MKKALALLLMFLVTNAYSSEQWWNPEKNFNARQVMTEKTTIEWHRVDNLQATCEAESKKRKLGGFGYSVEACSFWDKGFTGHTCHIFTRKDTNLHNLGHEVRHCFQGNFH